MPMIKSNWSKYLIDFLIVFIGVTLAFALSKWNEDRNKYKSAEKTLLEIRNGLEQDLGDMQQNQMGHENAIYGCDYIRKFLNNEEVEKDSVVEYYSRILRDFISIQNQSGYEALKSKGLELVQNDSLRLEIISLYDFYYEIIEKLEEDYSENQFHRTHSKTLNDIMMPYMVFDEKGDLAEIKQPIKISPSDKNAILHALWNITNNRKFCVQFYIDVQDKIKNLMKRIDSETT